MVAWEAGVDEVGRGCWFGPVFAAAVVLSEAAASALTAEGLTDSKALTARHRARLVPLIEDAVEAWALGQASAREIDHHGIRRATELAMLRALQRLPQQPALVLVDGVLPLRLWPHPQQTIVRGQQNLNAAGVLAKESRDAPIRRLANAFRVTVGTSCRLRHGSASPGSAGPWACHAPMFLLKKVLPPADVRPPARSCTSRGSHPPVADQHDL